MINLRRFVNSSHRFKNENDIWISWLKIRKLGHIVSLLQFGIALEMQITSMYALCTQSTVL